MRQASLRLGSRAGTGYTVPRIPEAVLLAALLALGVVLWGYFFHLRILGEEDVSLRGPVTHLATDGLLAFPPALLATLIGLRLAHKLHMVSRGGSRLLVGAGLISLVFFLVLIPSIPIHGYLDSAVFGEWNAHHGADDEGLFGVMLHGLRDAFLTAAAMLPLALVGLALLALWDRERHGARQGTAPARSVSPPVGASTPFARTVSRREALKYGGVGATALALNSLGFLAWPELARKLARGDISSPLVAPFQRPLNIPPEISPTGIVKTRDFGWADFYEITQQVSQGEIIPGTTTTFWGYNGITPGPTIRARRGRPVVVRQINDLSVRTATHLHGGDVPSADDGLPVDLVSPLTEGPIVPEGADGCGPEPDEDEFDTVHEGFQDHEYPNIQNGATLWYHDHAIHRTGRNVYFGLAGFYLLEDELEQSLPLPKGRFDVPIVIQDRLFAADGAFIFPCDGDDPVRQGVFGDVILVNGVPTPFLQVARRKYRFRILNGSNARLYQLGLSTGDPFTVIASDQGLFPAPVVTDEIFTGPAERYEAIIDFSRYPIGTQVILENRFGRAFGDPIDEERTRLIMRFDVVEDAPDPSSIPAVLAPARDIPESSAVRTRDWRFERRGGQWVINKKVFDQNRSDADPGLGDVEIWRFTNNSGGWVHPTHPHLVEFHILDRNGEAPRPIERGPKDTVLLGANEEIRTIMKFEHFSGPYVIHCHNIEHEDNDMMVRFDVVNRTG